ncbi:MAG: glycosyltransferase family A protein [Gammaproteobacteria bacterium]|nr:glycosyltransferase family A protein [Gammaproteobacteria bacterium]
MGIAFVGWVVNRLKVWVRQTAMGLNRARATTAEPTAALGIEVAARGELSRGVFRDFVAPPRRHEFNHVDVLLADTGADAIGHDLPAVVLSGHPQLAVPAFDPASFNPIGWQRDVKNQVGALGWPRLLPTGVTADLTVSLNDLEKARQCHHLVDVQRFHRSSVERAGVLVRLAASGVPVHLVDGGSELEPLLGSELYSLMMTDIRGKGATARELLSVALRRGAFRDHTLRARARQVSRIAGLDVAPDPTVSVLLATKRPSHLGHALGNIAKQTYRPLEVVLALHGDEFEDVAVEHAIARLDVPVTVRPVGGSAPLGLVLRIATDAAGGDFVTKMDDDDVYDASHVGDLMTAYGFSGAELVGKYHEVNYLASTDQTVEVKRGMGESYSLHVSGAALLMARPDLHRFGGWQRIPAGVDSALADDVLRGGGTIYRTHGAGFICVRHGQRHGHTWQASDDEDVDRAEAVHDGWCPWLAGMPDAQLPRQPTEASPAGASQSGIGV